LTTTIHWGTMFPPKKNKGRGIKGGYNPNKNKNPNKKKKPPNSCATGVAVTNMKLQLLLQEGEVT